MKKKLFLILTMLSMLTGPQSSFASSPELERNLQIKEVECVVRALENRNRDDRGSYQKQIETFRNMANPEGHWIDKVRFWKKSPEDRTGGWTPSQLEGLLEQSESQLLAELDGHQLNFIEALNSCQVF